MKPLPPQNILSDQLHHLHSMETHIARELPVLSGSVFDMGLRRLLSSCARRARERRDALGDLLARHTHIPAAKAATCIRGILAEGNRDLSQIKNPRNRDVAMLEHFIRIEQHAATAYGIAIPLITRIEYPEIGAELKSLLSDLEAARAGFKTSEARLLYVAGKHSPPAVGIHPSSPHLHVLEQSDEVFQSLGFAERRKEMRAIPNERIERAS